MKHPLPLLFASLFAFILGTSMLRNVTCPCGAPAAELSDVSTSKTVVAAVGVPTAVNYAAPKVAETLAATTTVAAVDNSRIQAIEQRLRTKELVLYFDYGQPTASLTDAQRKELAEVQYYIAHNPQSNISIVGHTDSRGKANFNENLSTARAHFVTEYLTELGGNAQKFTTEGKGEAAPAATNGTSKGRAKNRRVVISLT
jgi:outer membrane protein OmpA-like peptidoglycan-associated protein